MVANSPSPVADEIMVRADRSRELRVKRIAALAILFAALIEFAVERARFDLWIITIAMVTLLWNVVGKTLRTQTNKQTPNRNPSALKK
jgi:hypothetical protein